MKYTGPAKPIPTHMDIMSERAEGVVYLLLCAFLAVLLYLE